MFISIASISLLTTLIVGFILIKQNNNTLKNMKRESQQRDIERENRKPTEYEKTMIKLRKLTR